MEIPCVRVLVVGDSGVGKTTLLQSICCDPRARSKDEKTQQLRHRWTTGCDVHVLLHAYRDSHNIEREVYVEFIDVGGHPKYELSRGVFYYDVQGIVFVHDLSNAKSYDHLKGWNSEIATTQQIKGYVLSSHQQQPGNFPSLHGVPKLVIGNKKDLVSAHAKRLTPLPELRNCDSFESSADPLSLDLNTFHLFLERTIAFANNNSVGFGFETTNEYSGNGLANPFSDGLRQMKSKPTAGGIVNGRIGSALSMTSAPLSNGSSPGRGWW